MGYLIKRCSNIVCSDTFVAVEWLNAGICCKSAVVYDQHVHLYAGPSQLKYNVQTVFSTKIVSEYDQEIPQSQTADNPKAP